MAGILVIPLTASVGWLINWFYYLETGIGSVWLKLWNNRFTGYALQSGIGGNMAAYGFIEIVWLFSFIGSDFFQEAFLWSILVGVAGAFLNSLWVNVAFAVGGATLGGYWGDLYWAIVYDVVFLGMNAALFWGVMPDMVKFYKMQEKSWWNDDWQYYLEKAVIIGEMEDDISTFD